MVSSLPLKDKQLQALAHLKINPDLTNAELAAKAGVAERTISNWKKLPEWKEGMAMLPQAILKDTMFLKAASGDVQAFDKWMRAFGTEARPEDEFAAALNMTEADMEMIAKEAHDYWRSRKGRVIEDAQPEPDFEPAF